jgi:hypothetical protein
MRVPAEIKPVIRDWSLLVETGDMLSETISRRTRSKGVSCPNWCLPISLKSMKRKEYISADLSTIFRGNLINR